MRVSSTPGKSAGRFKASERTLAQKGAVADECGHQMRIVTHRISANTLAVDIDSQADAAERGLTLGQPFRGVGQASPVVREDDAEAFFRGGCGTTA